MTILENFDSRNFSNQINSKSKLTPSSRINPCEGCGDEKGNCRVKGDYRHKYLDEFILYCMGNNSSRKGELVGGNYKVIGHTKCGLWAMLKPDNSESWTEEKRRQWEQNKPQLEQQKQQKAQQQHQQKREKALSNCDRHKLYSETLDGLPQDDRLIAELQQRGFTPEEIANCGFKSVTKYQELPREFDKRLPGVTEDGKKLIVSGDGYLCPIRDFDGYIGASQVRLYNPGHGGRYRWVSSPEQTLPLLVGDSLENPLAVFHPVKPEGIALVEGTGAKPFLTSSRLNRLTIGAAGGQFDNSPNLLKNYLDRALDKVGGEKTLAIFIDAGDVQNRQVVNRWKRLAELLNNLGWDFKFAWWGQLTKNDCDIDELNCIEYPKIQYISAKEFFAIADKQLKLIEQQKQTADRAKEEQEELQKLTTVRYQLTHITEKPYAVVNVPHMGEVLADLIQPGAVTIVLGHPGTGKTEATVPIVEKSEAVHSWHNRISLANSTSKDLGISYKDGVINNKFGNKNKVAFCSPSALQFNPASLQNQGIVFLDECDQVFDFNFGSLCNKDGIRPAILATLEANIEAAIGGNGVVLAMSADVTQKEIDYIKKIVPQGTPVNLIINEYKPPKPNIMLDISKSPEGLLSELLKRIKSGVPCFFLDDMKDGVRGCKSIAEYIRQELPEVALELLEIHSDSSTDPNVKEFSERPDEKSKMYKVIGCSPSIISGISLKNGRFNHGVFAFCNGILADREIKQFLNRVRGAEEIFLWVAEQGFPVRSIPSNIFTPEEIGDYYQRNYEINIKHILSYKPDYNPIVGEWTSPHFELFKKNLSYRQICMKYLRHFVVSHLREIGYGIIETRFVPEGGIKETTEKLEKIWSNINLNEAKAIEAARILTEAEMDAIQHGGQEISSEIKPAYLKTRLLQTFGQELIDATTFTHKKSNTELSGFAAMALKNKGGLYGKHLDNFYLLNQVIEEASARDYAVEARQIKVSGKRFPGDIRWNATRRKGWEFLDFPSFIKPDQWWEPKDYQEMTNKARKYPQRMREAIGFSVEKINNGQIFGEMIYRVGLELDTQDVEGQNWKRRKISEESWKFAQMYLAHKQAMKVAKEPLPEVAAVPEIDSIVLMLIEYLPQAQTREQCEDLFGTVTESQKNEAWAMLSQEQQKRIYSLFEPQVIQPAIFEEVPPVEPVEVLAITDIEQNQQEPAVAEKVIPDESPIQNQQSRIEKLVKISNWAELGMTQSELDEVWPLLSESQRSHLWQLHQEYQQHLSLEELAQQAIATQAEIKETGFGCHFRTYILKAVRGGIAIARKCWGDKGECEISLNKLVLSG